MTMFLIGVSAVVVEDCGGYHEVQKIAEGEIPYLSFGDLVLLPQAAGFLPLERVLAHCIKILWYAMLRFAR